MVGADDALCVDRRLMGSGDITGVCGAEVEVLETIEHGVCVYDEGKPKGSFWTHIELCIAAFTERSSPLSSLESPRPVS